MLNVIEHYPEVVESILTKHSRAPINDVIGNRSNDQGRTTGADPNARLSAGRSELILGAEFERTTPARVFLLFSQNQIGPPAKLVPFPPQMFNSVVYPFRPSSNFSNDVIVNLPSGNDAKDVEITGWKAEIKRLHALLIFAPGNQRNRLRF